MRRILRKLMCFLRGHDVVKTHIYDDEDYDEGYGIMYGTWSAECRRCGETWGVKEDE